jgi:hypothetical protein
MRPMKNIDLKQLKGLNLPIVAPKELPGNFEVGNVIALPDDGYEIELRSGSAELKLKATTRRTDSQLKGAERIEFETRYFGECLLERSGEEIVSEWFSEMQSGFPAYSVAAKGLDPDEVIEFVRSLDYIRVN